MALPVQELARERELAQRAKSTVRLLKGGGAKSGGARGPSRGAGASAGKDAGGVSELSARKEALAAALRQVSEVTGARTQKPLAPGQRNPCIASPLLTQKGQAGALSPLQYHSSTTPLLTTIVGQVQRHQILFINHARPRMLNWHTSPGWQGPRL